MGPDLLSLQVKLIQQASQSEVCPHGNKTKNPCLGSEHMTQGALLLNDSSGISFSAFLFLIFVRKSLTSLWSNLELNENKFSKFLVKSLIFGLNFVNKNHQLFVYTFYLAASKWGVSPLLFLGSDFAPFSIRHLTLSRYPYSDAKCKGVIPSYKGPIIYFIEGRSLSRHKQKFCN